MWHEARKQEKMIRGMIVDYRRRAERRKDFYEKIKAEPTQFLQLHGRQCKIHLDPAVAAAGEGPAIMMPWQGDTKNMIDRFDVRAHLDIISEVKAPDIPPEDLNQEERHCNYERYRILAQNGFLGISEDKFLQQLAMEEQFGVTIEEKEMQREKLSEKKGTGAAIGYNYNDPTAQPSTSNGPDNRMADSKESDDDSDMEMIDVDLSIDVNKMDASQAHELNAVGPQYGMAGCDLFSFLTGDADDAEHQKQLLREEKEKAMFSGRKSRRERRAHRDKKLASRVVSPPSYAAVPSIPAVPSRSPSRSRSRTPSPDNSSIQFITSFGPEDDENTPLPPKPLYADKVKQNLKKGMSYSEVLKKTKSLSSSFGAPIGPRLQSQSRSRSRSRSRSSRKPRSLSRSSRKSRSRSRSYHSYRKTHSRSRSRSNSRNRRRTSRSVSNHASNTNRNRSLSFESKDKSQSQSKPIPRYYGRRKEDKSSSELSLDSDTTDSNENTKSASGKSNPNQNQLRLSGSSSKGLSREALSMKEKLKRKMQAQLSRQLRADKRAEAARVERESRRQARRNQEMKDLAIKLRRKQREMRHQQYRRSSDEDNSDKSGSETSSRKSIIENRREERSRSKSKPLEDKPIQVWDSKVSPTFKSKYEGETSNSSRKHYQNSRELSDNQDGYRERRYGDDDPQNKYRQSREYNRNYSHDGNHYDNHDRIEDRFQNVWRQAYDKRGAFKKRSERSDGPSNRHRDNDSNYRNKVKLVDY